MRRNFRRRRPRKRFLWSGIQATGDISGGVAYTVVQILGPSQVSTVADMLVERVVFDLQLRYNTDQAVVAEDIGAYVTVCPTGTDEVPTGLWQPRDTDIDATQKRPMWWRRFLIPPRGGISSSSSNYFESGMGTGSPAYTGFPGDAGTGVDHRAVGGFLNGGQPFDINVKRKLAGDQALVLVLQGTSAASPLPYFNVLARALVSVGRK